MIVCSIPNLERFSFLLLIKEKNEDAIFDILADSFADKFTLILKIRSASLLAFGRWKKSIYVSEACGIFPITEEMAHD